MALLSLAPDERPTGLEVLARLDETAASSKVTTSEHRSSPRHSIVAPFIGRAEQLSILERALDETENGKPVIVCVRGQSGMGKSALLKRFEDEAQHERGTVVLSGRCYERESVTYKALDGSYEESWTIAGTPE